MHICPVCGYDALRRPPKDHTICPCCGVEFGYDDAGPVSAKEMHAALRRRWIDRDAKWHSLRVPRPDDWNPWVQLAKARLPYDVSWQRGVANAYRIDPSLFRLARMTPKTILA